MNNEQVLDQYKDRTILITGGAGCVGSNLIKTLLPVKPKRVIVLDDFSSSYRWNLPSDPLLEVVEGSILDDESMKHVFYSRPDFVFHLAAHFANQNSIEHPETDLLVNGLGTMKVLEYSRLVEPERVVFAGSGCSVYGSYAKIPFTEGTVSLTLDTPYQVHKLLGELYCNHYHETFGLKTAIGRFFNVYGPGEAPGRYRNVIPNFMWLAIHNRPLTITGTGDETRDFAYVGDIVNGLLRMAVIDAAVGEAINLASGVETSIKDLANMVIEVTGSGSEIIFGEKRSWDKSNRRLASIEKGKKLIGYEPTMEFKRGLEKVYEWIRTNKENIESTMKPEYRLW